MAPSLLKTKAKNYRRGGTTHVSTDTSEKGLESLIMRHMTGVDGLVFRTSMEYLPRTAGYHRHAESGLKRLACLKPEGLRPHPRAGRAAAFPIPPNDPTGCLQENRHGRLQGRQRHRARLKFLARLSNDIGARGVIDVLRKGVEHLGAPYFDSSLARHPGQLEVGGASFAKNRFSITRQLRYSLDEQRARSIGARSSTACRSRRLS